MTVIETGFPHPNHDHRSCIGIGLEAADLACAEQGLKLTRDRRQVLEILLESHAALGAYDICERMDWQGRKPASSVVYRGLSFLTELGLVHKLHTRNAYVACSQPGEDHGTQFLICRRCDTIVEIASRTVDEALVAAAVAVEFEVQNPVVEIAGLCPYCANVA